MESLNLPDPKKSEKSGDTSEGDAKQAGRSRRRAQETKVGSGPFSSFMERLWNMLPGGSEEERAQAALDDRESSRLPAAIPVMLFGRDEDGQAFRETTRTVDISKRGARIITLHNLQTDTHIWIENPGAGKISIAKVIRKGQCIDPQEATEICVKVLELLDPEKIWDIESPPRDWERGFEPPTPAQRLEYLLARERLARPEVLSFEAIETPPFGAEAEKEKREPLALGEPGTSPPQNLEMTDPPSAAGLEPEFASESYAAHPIVTPQPRVQFREVSETAEAEVTRSPEAAPESSASPALEEPEASRRISPGKSRHELAQAFENNTQAVRKVAEAAMDSINSAGTEAMARLRAEQLRTEADLAVHTAAHQNRLAEISSATEELERRSEVLLQEFQKKLEATLQAFQQKSATLTDNLQVQDETASRDAEAATNSIILAGERARAQLESARAELESKYAALAEAQDKRMADLSSAVEGLEQRVGVLVSNFEKALEDALQVFQQKGAAGTAELERAAQALLENSRRKLQGHADATVAGLGEKARATLAMTAVEGRNQVASTQQALESLARAAGERFDQRLAQKSKEQAEIAAQTSEAAVNTIKLSAERAVNRLEAAEKKIEEGFSTWADVFQSRLAELFAGMEGLERHSQTLLRDFRDQLELALQEFLERKTAETSNLEEASHDGMERLAQQVKEQADATIEKMREEAQAVVRSAEEKSRTHLANATEALGSATRAAAELYARRLDQTSAEQTEDAWLNADEVASSIGLAAEEAAARVEAAQAKMEARFTALVEMHEKRAAEISSSLEEFERRAEAVLNDFRDRLQGVSTVAQQEEAADFPREKPAGAH